MTYLLYLYGFWYGNTDIMVISIGGNTSDYRKNGYVYITFDDTASYKKSYIGASIFWYHDPTYLPFSLCIVGARCSHSLLAGYEALSYQVNVSQQANNLGAYFISWYNNSQLCYTPFGGDCDNKSRCGMSYVSVANVASEYRWITGALKYFFGMIIHQFV